MASPYTRHTPTQSHPNLLWCGCLIVAQVIRESSITGHILSTATTHRPLCHCGREHPPCQLSPHSYALQLRHSGICVKQTTGRASLSRPHRGHSRPPICELDLTSVSSSDTMYPTPQHTTTSGCIKSRACSPANRLPQSCQSGPFRRLITPSSANTRMQRMLRAPVRPLHTVLCA